MIFDALFQNGPFDTAAGDLFRNVGEPMSRECLKEINIVLIVWLYPSFPNGVST